jgi:hypothetical protein
MVKGKKKNEKTLFPSLGYIASFKRNGSKTI